jgi:protein-tyrosine phosphatase
MQRQLLLEGGRNFRDLGGYRTVDGRSVRWRRIFRSGVLTYLSPADRAQLEELDIRASCDFRDEEERAREPTLWPRSDVRKFAWNHVRGSLGMRKLLAGRELDADFGRSTMLAFYARLPYRFVTQYTDMLRLLAEGAAPLVINCAAGKDRTGMAAALILASLGVPREQILEDYALTDHAVDLERELFAHPRTSVGFGADRELIAKVSPEARAPLLQARPEYLQSAFEQIESREGSVDVFLRNTLGLTEERRKALRGHLLEP